MTRLITVAIHTYEKALQLRSLLEQEGIPVVLNNVNLEQPSVSSGIRVRIPEDDLPLALRIIENREVFTSSEASLQEDHHSVLVPVDFSDHSMEAVKAAVRLAHRHKAGIKLLHSFIDPYLAANMQFTDNLTYEIADSDSRKILEKEATEKMARFADRVRTLMKEGEIPVVKYSTKILEGVPEDAIVEYAKINPPFVGVMGTRGADRKAKEMVGSVTAEVIDSCLFTVITIPEGTSAPNFRKSAEILFFINLEQNDMLAMDTFQRIFPDLSAHITLAGLPRRRRLLSGPVSKAAMESLQYYFTAHFPMCTFTVCDADGLMTSKGLADSDKLGKYDMIMVSNHKRTSFSRMINPSIAHNLLFATDTPMIIIPV